MNLRKKVVEVKATDKPPCRMCHGTGKITVIQTKNGKTQEVKANCPSCTGSGTKGIVTK